MMNSYQHLDILLRAHVQELERQSAMAALAAQVVHASRPTVREQLARVLRGIARSIEPGCERPQSVDLGARA